MNTWQQGGPSGGGAGYGGRSGGPGAPLPPSLDPRGAGGPGGSGARPVGRRRWPRRRVVTYAVLGVVGALLATSAGTYFWADSKLHHQDVLADYGSRRRRAREPTG